MLDLEQLPFCLCLNLHRQLPQVHADECEVQYFFDLMLREPARPIFPAVFPCRAWPFHMAIRALPATDPLQSPLFVAGRRAGLFAIPVVLCFQSASRSE